VDRVELSDLQAGVLTSSWFPRVEHPGIAPEMIEAISKSFSAGLLLAIRAGSLQSDDTWNRLLPDYKAESAEVFLRRAWEGQA